MSRRHSNEETRRARAGLIIPAEYEPLFRNLRVVREAARGRYQVYYRDNEVPLISVRDDLIRGTDAVETIARMLMSHVCFNCGELLSQDPDRMTIEPCPSCRGRMSDELVELLADLEEDPDA